MRLTRINFQKHIWSWGLPEVSTKHRARSTHCTQLSINQNQKILNSKRQAVSVSRYSQTLLKRASAFTPGGRGGGGGGDDDKKMKVKYRGQRDSSKGKRVST